MFEKTEGANKNGQYSDTGNIGHTTQHRKQKGMSNTDLPTTQGWNQAPMPQNLFFAEQTFVAQICVLSQSNLSISLFENILRLK